MIVLNYKLLAHIRSLFFDIINNYLLKHTTAPYKPPVTAHLYAQTEHLLWILFDGRKVVKGYFGG